MANTTLSPGTHILSPSSPDLQSIIDGIVHIHASAILVDHTLATFLPPLSHPQMHAWWTSLVADIPTGSRHIIFHLSPISSRMPYISSNGTTPSISAPFLADSLPWPTLTTSLEISGVITLSTPFSQTGPFRGTIEKFFVHPLHRRRGIGRALLTRLENLAWKLGRWNLMLDTEVGSGAESVYERVGYERVGVVREYGYSPEDGRLVDEVWFVKDLRRGRG